jgi:uncharacterized protein YeeX (DUF496 family)
MNRYKESKGLRIKEPKKQLSLYIELADYVKIEGNKTQKIIRILEEVVSDYEQGKERYK